MNLVKKFPIIYWNTANLIVDSSGLDDDNEEEEDTESEQEIESDSEEDTDEKEKKKKNKNVKYGKISSAIGKMREAGVNIVPPDVNTSSFTFTPDVENNRIFYGIKGISKVNKTIAKDIIGNRPYSNIEDFMSKVKVTKTVMANLIKSGCLDSLYGFDRIALANAYTEYIAETKKKLTIANMPSLIKYELIPAEFSTEKYVYNFNKYLKKECKIGDSYFLDDYSQHFYSTYFDIDKCYHNDNGECFILQKDWDKIYKTEMAKLKPFLSDIKTLQSLNEKILSETKEKYFLGGVQKWEMDSLGFYNKGHELDFMNIVDYDLVDFSKLPEEAIVSTYFKNGEKQIPLYHLDCIAGTVLEKDKLKNIVTILTQHGVVKLKIYKQQFNKYDKQISEKDEETNKKKIIEKSWFTRGNIIMVQGLRRGDFFIPKAYKNSRLKPISLLQITDYNNYYYNLITERTE